MYIETISKEEFNEFANKHILKNFYQTAEYGELMRHSDFSVMYIGGFQKKELVAASLILYKEIGPKMKYGYAPRGFLVDYNNEELLISFTKKVKEFFFLKGFAFIKINPEISYAILDYKNKTKIINTLNKKVMSSLKDLGYSKLKDNLYYESLLPKYTPVIYLPGYDINSLGNKLTDKIELAHKKGLHLISGSEEDIETFYEFVENKKNKTIAFYKYLYKQFKASDMIDLILVEINYNLYVKYLQKEYIYQMDINEEKNEYFNEHPDDKNAYEEKMKSDKIVNDLSYSIAFINTRMKNNEKNEIIGGALVIKHQGRVTIYISGQSNVYEEVDVKTFLFYKIIDEYKKANYKFLDLYGITGDFSDNNPFKKHNDFKLSFKPTVYEYIGEYDLIVNKTFHQILLSTNKIQKEFYKPVINPMSE